MRRMPTTKQLELLEYLSKGIEINNYPETMTIPFKYVNQEEIEEFLQEKVKDESLDFKTHTIDSAYITYYYDEDFEEGYIEIDNDDPFSFPETINTISELANWLKNNLPIIELSYIADIQVPELPNIDKYNWSETEYEFINSILYVTGYNASQSSILEASIDTIKSNQIFVTTIGTANNHVNNAYISTINTAIIDASTSIRGLTVTATGQLYGQLGLSNRRSNAYISNGYFNNVLSPKIEFEQGTYIEKTQEEGINVVSYGNLSLSSDSNISIGSSGNIILTVPSSDPHVAGALWKDNGVLKVSSGE